MPDEILAQGHVAQPAHLPGINFPLINVQLHPSGQWTPGLYKGFLISKALEAIGKLSFGK